MKKNVIFLICVKSQHKYLDDKHGGFKYFEFSITLGSIGVRKIM